MHCCDSAISPSRLAVKITGIGPVLAIADPFHELGLRGPVMVTEHTAHRRCSRNHSRLFNSTHRHAEVFCLDDYCDSSRVEFCFQPVCDRSGQLFLNPEALRRSLHVSRNLAEPCDSATRNVTDPCITEERNDMMGTKSVERNRSKCHHFVRSGREGSELESFKFTTFP